MTDEYNENGKESKAEGLKKSFGSGQIPTQATFSELIDLADVGRKTLGFNEGDFTQPPQPGSGLTVPDVNHPLQVNIAADKSGGLKFNEVTHALELTVDGKQSGLVLEKDKGLMVKPGLGIRVDESGVAVKTAPDGGLEPTDEGLMVKLGAGLIVEKANEPVKLHIAEKGGLSLIEPNATNQLSVKVNQDKGLDIDPTEGVQLKADMGWFEFKDKQLKFTDIQLTKFKEAAVQAGSGALDKAVSGTSTGSRQNSNPNQSKLEQDIAKALNDAYGEGHKAAYCETVKPDVRKTSLSIFAKAQPVNLRQLAQVSPSRGGELCFTKGNTPDNEWKSIVAQLSRDGDITLRGAGRIAVLVQELTQDPNLLSRAVQFEVQVGMFGARKVDLLGDDNGTFVSFEYSTDESGTKVTITARKIPRKFYVARPAQDDFSTTTGKFELVTRNLQAKPELSWSLGSLVPVVISTEDDPNDRGGRSSRLTFEVSSKHVGISPDANQPGPGWPGKPGSGWPGSFDTEWWTLDLPDGPYKIAEYTDTDGMRCQVFLAQG
ncbi:hypothetical protein KQH49_07305 [Mycetohabitans sp. B5]|uniref:Uncharacterized protein n=1 Tax=Mycetohabitans endofungorum TaxID=417203 RepID=A0A2P5KAW0_9BURK|nr:MULTISPECIES: hypothetical protein [Mycetohabitans]MCG1054773.1 hypothetical protein [Mycetohabitans sp. B5]PPB83831.1 hypothetical protein B0O95_10512 [Mycetohabitans endofungorum]